MNAAPLPQRSFEPRPLGHSDPGETGLVGSSEAIERLRRSILRVAPLEDPVFLSGEAGSGKKEAARALHRASPRGHLPLVIVECGAHSNGDSLRPPSGTGEGGLEALLGSSQIGSVLFSGLDQAPLPVQRRFLTAMGEDRGSPRPAASTVHGKARILTAAGADYPQRVLQGRFLAALSERLARLEIPVPALRSRVRDIPELVRHWVVRISRQLGRPSPIIDPEVESALLHHSWPGNVRELRRLLEQALVLLEGRVLRQEDLPGFSDLELPGGTENLRKARREFERQHVERNLLQLGGDKQKVAKTLGVDVTTVYRILARDQKA